MPGLAGLVRRNYRDAIVPAAVGGIVAGTVAPRGGRRREAIGAAAGGGLAETAWRVGGLDVIQRRGKDLERPAPGQTRSAYQKLVRDHKQAHGVGGLQGPELRRALSNKPDYFRSYPKELGGWRYKRVLGQMSGTRGRLIEAGLVAGGAEAGLRASRKVSKGPRLMPGFTLSPAVLAHKNWAKAGAATVGATALGHEVSHRRGRHDQAHAILGAGVGAIAGQGAYQAPAYAHQAFVRGRNVPDYMRRDVRQSELPPEQKPLKRKHEAERRDWKAQVRARGMSNAEGYRLYPKHWPNARAERLQGWTHAGRSGQLIGSAATAAGAIAGVRAADQHYRHRVSKGVLLPMIRVVSSDVRGVLAGVRDMGSSAVTPSMREGVRRTASSTPRSFVYAAGARKGSQLVF